MARARAMARVWKEGMARARAMVRAWKEGMVWLGPGLWLGLW